MSNRQLTKVNLANALKTMFKNIKSGETVYLAFSKRSFHILIFTLAMGVIANIVLVDLLLSAPTIVERPNNFVYAAQLALSITAIVSALWLFFRGVNIATEK